MSVCEREFEDQIYMRRVPLGFRLLMRFGLRDQTISLSRFKKNHLYAEPVTNSKKDQKDQSSFNSS